MKTASDIIEFFKDITFEEKEHIYSVNGVPIKESVSDKIKQYYKPFNKKVISHYSALKHGVSQESLVKDWDNKRDIAIIKGNKAHLFGELYPFNRELRPQSPYDLAIMKFWNDLPPHIIPIIAEARMYHKEDLYAGTPDFLLYNTLTGYYIILDYKGLPLDTPIPTDKGWCDMGKLTLEHKVFDKDGKICNIKNISNIHFKKCLKMKFDNNEEIISDFEHRWLIYKGENKKGFVWTTQEIKDYLEKTGDNPNTFKTLRIYNSKPINIENVSLPIDPYVLGVWLGDGHNVDGKITQSNPLVWEEIEKRGFNIGSDISQGGAGKAQTKTVFGLDVELQKLNLKKNKHIPEIYLFSSIEQRKDLLRGFMDADGYYNKTRKRFVLTTTRKQQADFSVELLSSLGIKATLISCIKYCSGKKFSGYDVCFTLEDFNPFLCRNQEIKIKAGKQHRYRRIVSVEEVEQVPTKCIEVDSESNTYLATKSMIPTHNTNIDIFKNYNNQKMLTPFEHLLDNPYNKYQLQFSYYQILVEQIEGIKVSSRKLLWLLPDASYLLYDTDDYTKYIS